MAELPHIAFFDTKPYDRSFFEQANESYGFPITWFTPRLDIETASLAAGFPVVCAFVNDMLNAQILERLWSSARLIALRSAGYNNVDMRAAYGHIHVVRVPEYSPYAVAEHTVLLMLALNRKIHRAYNRVRDGNFALSGLLGFDMHGKTVGVIGTGKIGRRVIAILRGFDMRVVATDPYPNREAEQRLGFTYVSPKQLYGESDIITLHCPLTPENIHLVNEESIAVMKRGVMIINTGRGGLIHTRDLVEGLKNGAIGSAGLDVYEEETDYFFEDHSNNVITDDTLARLMTFPNVLITSHQGFFTREALTNIAETTLGNIHDFFTKGESTNEICYRCSQGTCVRKETGKCFA
jgi:D-lactate dehydrogenase